MRHLFSEAIKLKDGILYDLPYHQARLERTQAKFGGTVINLSEVLSDIPAHVRTGLFKCRVEYGLHLEKIEFVPYIFRKIRKVSIVADDSIDYGFKFTNRKRLDDILLGSDCDDIIIVKRGLVTDGHSSNLVFRSSEGLFTPDSYLLRGTKREKLLGEKVIAERRITIDDICLYSHIHFINAMVDIEDGICVETADILRRERSGAKVR